MQWTDVFCQITPGPNPDLLTSTTQTTTLYQLTEVDVSTNSVTLYFVIVELRPYFRSKEQEKVSLSIAM